MKGYIAQRTPARSSSLTMVKYAGALIAVVIAVQLGLWLEPIVDSTVLLLMALLAAAWFRGLWPALFASILATLAVDYFFTPPLYTFTLEFSHIPHLLTFALIAALFATASAARRNAERSLQQARDQLDLKVQERTADLVRTHAEAVAAQQRFRDLVNSIEGIVWEADARTFEFTFVSRQAERVLGYPVERWLKDPMFWRDHIHQDDRESAVNDVVSATEQKRDRDFEYRMIAADGRTVWLRDLVSVLVEDNQAIKLRGVMLDVTARKQVEQALSEQANLLNLTHDSIFVRDMRDVIRYWNRGAEELYGWTSDEAVGQVSHRLTQTIFPAQLEDINAQLLRTGRWEGELVQRTRDGSQVVVASRWSLQAGAEGEPIAILETNNDMTRRKRAEQELEELAGRLIHAQEQERSRIGRELHDHISQMLGVLAIRIDQLRAEEATPPAVAAELEELRQSTSEVTDDIHSLSHRLHSSALDYLGLVPALQKLVGEFSGRHGIAVDFVHDSVPSPMPSDVALCLFRVAEEGLANIAKHSHAKSAHVHVNGASDGLRLTIEDAGRGFDVESLERRAGLGFVSMRERLRVLRGTFRVDSAPSHGTKIDVWVPAASLVARTPGGVARSTTSDAHATSNVGSA
jgi:PAS domain S-box-containing protein